MIQLGRTDCPSAYGTTCGLELGSGPLARGRKVDCGTAKARREAGGRG